MFSQTITESDVFLDMPVSTQLLYFHLGMYADDDGFVSPKRVMRMVGASDDDLKILLGKRYVLGFNSGVIIIKHWLVNNQIRPDRYHQTTYKEELSTLTKNAFGAYSEIAKITTNATDLTDDVYQMSTVGIPDVIPTVNPGKVRLGKASIDGIAKAIPTAKNEIDEMIEFWNDTVDIRSRDNVTTRKAIASLLREYGRDGLKKLVRGVQLSLDDRYAPRIASFAGLKRKSEDLLAWGRKQQGKGITRI